MAARQGVLAAVIAFRLIAAPAATIRKGTVEDRPSDTDGGGPGHDILQAVGVSDDAGAAAIAIRVAGTPPASAFVSGALGTLQADGRCWAPYVVFTGMVGSQEALFARDTDTRTTFPARLAVDGNTVTIAAQDAARLALALNCGYASTRSVTNVVHDETAEFPFTVEPPPPAATPAPPAPVPAPTTATTRRSRSRSRSRPSSTSPSAARRPRSSATGRSGSS